MPVNVSPPLSNILMNLDVRQLREILIEIISWDATGKDIFDTDYLFQDPIKVRPNIRYPRTDRSSPSSQMKQKKRPHHL